MKQQVNGSKRKKKQLLTVTTNEHQEQVVSGRELHEFLQVGTEYAKWFSRMAEYGFSENQDYVVIVKNDENPKGGRPSVDHAIKIDMAKEISMLQRNERGKQARQYFIQLEREWNSPEKVMARALKIAEFKISNLQLETAQQKQIINELQPKATYYDLILQNKTLLSISKIAKDYGMSGTAMNKLLHELGVQYKQGDCWLLYQKHADKGYTQSKTHQIDDLNSKMSTQWTQKGRLFIYELLKRDGIYPMIERESRA